MIVAVQSDLERFTIQVYFCHNLVSEGTRESYLESVRLFDRYVRTVHGVRLVMAEYSVELFGGFLIWLIEVLGDAASTADKHRRQLVPILRLARKRELVPLDPDEIPQPKKLARLPLAWSQPEFARLVLAAMSMPGSVGPWPAKVWFPALIFTVYSTGWRITANMALLTTKVCLERGYAISIERKGRQERFAPLLPEAVHWLGRIWEPTRREVFGDWRFDRSKRQWSTLNDRLGELIVSAGIPDIGRWHAIRKTAITLTAANSDLETARRFAGHTHSRVTSQSYIDPRHMPMVRPVLPAISPPSSERQLDLF